MVQLRNSFPEDANAKYTSSFKRLGKFIKGKSIKHNLRPLKNGPKECKRTIKHTDAISGTAV